MQSLETHPPGLVPTPGALHDNAHSLTALVSLPYPARHHQSHRAYNRNRSVIHTAIHLPLAKW